MNEDPQPGPLLNTVVQDATSERGESARREAPSPAELRERLAQLPPDRAAKISGRIRQGPVQPNSEVDVAVPDPEFASWEDFLARTSEEYRRRWCMAKAKTANRERLMSGRPEEQITWRDVLLVLDGAQGCCRHCGSLAVQKRPSKSNGAPARWYPVGRRIGSVGHEFARFFGGINAPDNLIWSCLWCNTWPTERRLGATDHGGVFPQHAKRTRTTR